MIYDESFTVDGVRVRILDRTGVYDYSWSEFAVMRGDDGYLYWGHTAGCSCNSFEENLDQLNRAGSWHDVAEAVKQWRDDDYLDSPEKQGALDLIERLMRDQPPAFDEAAVKR